MKEKFYITTSIAYVNAAPHIGYALEMTQADVIARYHRLLGENVYFLTGVDEHGATNLRAAEKTGKNIKYFVDENTEKFQNLLRALNISNDDFIRTSDQNRHWPGARLLWKKLAVNRDIYKAFYKGLYCVGCEAFITEKDLANGKCELHGKEPEIIEEENYFFRLSKYTKEIETRIKNNELRIIPETRKNEILSLLKRGLEDISFSRPSKDISWGVPVPDDSSQTMYVWCDALVNYISALGYGASDFQPPTSNFQLFWPADLHIIGKDILRFHAAIWPGMLLSAGLELPKAIFVHGFITSAGQKMSKTLGNVVDPFVLAKKFGADGLRYYLTRAIPPFEDGDFTEEKFLENYNANLANGLGNLISRVIKMAGDYFEGKIEKPTENISAAIPLTQDINIFLEKNYEHNRDLESFSLPYAIDKFIWSKYIEAMKNLELNKAMDIIWSLISITDKYIDEYKPFILVKSDKEKTKGILWNLLYCFASLAWLLEPFLPETSKKIFEILNISKESKTKWQDFNIIVLPISLFPRK